MKRRFRIYILVILSACSMLTPSVNRANQWRQTTWEGGAGQTVWSDSTMYLSGDHVETVLYPGLFTLYSPNDGTWYATPALPGATEVHALALGLDGTIYAGANPDGHVFKSTNGGVSWIETGALAGAGYVFALAVGTDGAVYAGTGYNGDVYKTTNGGATWSVTGDLSGAESACALFAAPNGTIYAGTRFNGDLFKTTNGGTTWTNTGNLAGVSNIRAVTRTAGGTLYAGTRPNGKVFKSTNDGSSWTETASLSPTPDIVRALLAATDGAVYAGASPTGDVFKTTNGGTSWNLVGDLSGAEYLFAFTQAYDGAIYVTTSPDGRVFTSDDAGQNWNPTGGLAQASDALAIIQASDRALYVGFLGSNSIGRVAKAGYFTTGNLISSAYHAENASVEYGQIDWQSDLYGGGLVVRVRTDSLPDMSAAPEWNLCPPVARGTDISGLSSVEDGAPYVQYRLDITSPEVHTTPEVTEISLFYTLDTIPPKADSAVCTDNVLPGGGIDGDDEVLIYFDEPTNSAVVTATNIDQVLSLTGGHYWTDGSGAITDAYWNPAGDLLTIQLSVNVSPPTVSVGDTVTLDGSTITDRWGNSSLASFVLEGSFGPGTGIEDTPASGTMPKTFQLAQNYPNPFNPLTRIVYEIPDMGENSVPVELLIFDARGRAVRRFIEGERAAGRYTVTWDGTDARGSRVTSGVYFYVLKAGDFSAAKKMLLVK